MSRTKKCIQRRYSTDGKIRIILVGIKGLPSGIKNMGGNSAENILITKTKGDVWVFSIFHNLQYL
jgi:hypothetical protein|tara:strand:+ start:1123 stop:1317 length:195 start_codon:yes stop_codon:yes gene_type:complete